MFVKNVEIAKQIQYPSEYRTSLVFKWSKHVWLLNGPVFEWWSGNRIEMSVFIARSDCMKTRKRVSEKWNVWVLGI